MTFGRLNGLSYTHLDTIGILSNYIFTSYKTYMDVDMRV